MRYAEKIKAIILRIDEIDSFSGNHENLIEDIWDICMEQMARDPITTWINSIGLSYTCPLDRAEEIAFANVPISKETMPYNDPNKVAMNHDTFIRAIHHVCTCNEEFKALLLSRLLR